MTTPGQRAPARPNRGDPPMLRRALLSVAVLASLAAPALAGDFSTGGIPVVTNNIANNTNVAAGTGNTAFQSANQFQNGSTSPYLFGKGGSTFNNASNTNIAAGEHNTAFQTVTQNQFGSFGKGSPTVNSASNLNLAAGFNNTAVQSVNQNQFGSTGFPSLSRR